MNLIEKMKNVDTRIIYIVLLIVLSVPLLRPIGIPMQIIPMTRAVYDIIGGLDP